MHGTDHPAPLVRATPNRNHPHCQYRAASAVNREIVVVGAERAEHGGGAAGVSTVEGDKRVGCSWGVHGRGRQACGVQLGCSWGVHGRGRQACGVALLLAVGARTSDSNELSPSLSFSLPPSSLFLAPSFPSSLSCAHYLSMSPFLPPLSLSQAFFFCSFSLSLAADRARNLRASSNFL